MSRVEHRIWVDYGTTQPSHVGTHDGVPVIWLYQQPQRQRQSAKSTPSAGDGTRARMDSMV